MVKINVWFVQEYSVIKLTASLQIQISLTQSLNSFKSHRAPKHRYDSAQPLVLEIDVPLVQAQLSYLLKD
jgi:hypothetical protein